MRAIGCLLLVPGLFVVYGSAWAQQPGAASFHAKIQCGGQPYVTVTADEEQSIPLQVVEKASCGEGVMILSDPQGYTVKVATAAGKIGYVTRYQIAIVSSPKQASAGAGSASNGFTPSAVESPGAGSPAGAPKGQVKPRVYISDTASWEASGGFSNSSSVAQGALYGGYNPEMVDVYQDFTSDCAAVTVTQEKSNADYAILFDKGTSKKGFKGLGGLVKVNKVTVVVRNGQTILSDESHSADAVVQKACAAVSQTPATSTAASQNGKAPH